MISGQESFYLQSMSIKILSQISSDFWLSVYLSCSVRCLCRDVLGYNLNPCPTAEQSALYSRLSVRIMTKSDAFDIDLQDVMDKKLTGYAWSGGLGRLIKQNIRVSHHSYLFVWSWPNCLEIIPFVNNSSI